MQNLRVTLVQANQIWENKDANYLHYEQLLTAVETDLIVLPEMFHTGFSMNTAKLAEKWKNSEGIKWLQNLASRKNAAVYTSLIIEDVGNFYNRGAFIFPTGEIEYYDKRKSFGLAGEDKFYTPGTRETIVNYKGWRIQLQICYDLRFPEIVRNKIDSNQMPTYDVIVYVANWPEKRILHWNTLLKARAIENQCFVIGVNRVGTDGKNLLYSGGSVTIDALGTELVSLPREEATKTTVLNMNELNEIREILPFLKDR